MSAPMLVPAIMAGFTANSSKASSTAIWASPRAPPPPNAKPTLWPVSGTVPAFEEGKERGQGRLRRFLRQEMPARDGLTSDVGTPSAPNRKRAILGDAGDARCPPQGERRTCDSSPRLAVGFIGFEIVSRAGAVILAGCVQ